MISRGMILWLQTSVNRQLYSACFVLKCVGDMKVIMLPLNNEGQTMIINSYLGLELGLL